MVSVSVQILGTLHFVNLGAKVNGGYYQNELLEMMLPEVRILAAESRVRALFHESNRRLYKTKIMTKNKTS